jgi:protein TonB
MSMSVPVLRARDRLAPPPRRRRDGLEREGGVSLLVHALLIIALIVLVARKPLQPAHESSPIAVIFEGGAKPAPNRSPESRRSAPPINPDVNQHENAPIGATPSVRPSPAQAPPQTAPAPAAGQPAQSAPPAQTGASPMQVPPHSQVTAPTAPPHPAARANRRRAAPASPFASLSAPMTFSLAGRPPPPASEGHLSRGFDPTLAPTAANASILTRYATARHALGEDWWAAFSNYVEQHKYYPLSAAEHGEDGQSVLFLTIARDGSVKSVRLERSSGSQRLDDAWISEFRGAKVPPFPEGTAENEISFPASMTYILEHL